MKTIFIINPAAGFGKCGKSLAKLKELVVKKLGDVDFWLTQSPGDGVRLTQKALKARYELVVAVGGDGTVHECLNGFFHKGKPVNPKAVLGVLPFGRGSDFSRTLAISHDPQIAIEHFLDKSFESLDVGRISYVSLSGEKKERHFINIANVGFVPHVVEEGKSSPRLIGRKTAYLYGTIAALLRYRPETVRYRVYGEDNEPESLPRTETILNIVLANGRYFGANMKVAPKAKLDDGLLDILIIKKMNPIELALHFQRLYVGGHTGLSQIHYIKARKIEISPADQSSAPLVEADGEVLGRLPATFEILPKAIRFKV